MNETINHYGKVSRYLHWAMAVCYLAMFGTAVAWNIDESLKFLINPHRAIGVLLLVLTIFRVIWAVINTKQSPKKYNGCQTWALGVIRCNACCTCNRYGSSGRIRPKQSSLD